MISLHASKVLENELSVEESTTTKCEEAGGAREMPVYLL